MNALRLVQQNPGLRTLEFEHCRRHYGLSHFDPQVLAALSKHPSLTKINIQLNYNHQDNSQILIAILKHLPDSLQELEFRAQWDRNSVSPWTSSEDSSRHFLEGILKPNRCLRRLTIHGTVTGRTPPRVILHLLKTASQLSELSLGLIAWEGELLLQDVVTACPSLEVLSLKNQGSQWPNRPIIGSLLSLRDVSLHMGPEFVFATCGQEVHTITELLGRSGPSLRTVHISVWNGGPSTDVIFLNLKPCTHLTSLWIEGSRVPLWTASQVPWQEDFPHLQVLKLSVQEQEDDCRAHAFKAYKETGRLEGVSEHAREVALRICALFRSLKALKDLQEVSLKWDLCATVQSLSQEVILPVLASHLDDNDDNQEGSASPTTGIEVMEFLGLTWRTLAEIHAQAASYKKLNEAWLMRPRDSQTRKPRSVQRRHGSVWADWEALGNDLCFVCKQRDLYRDCTRCYCDCGVEVYGDMETAASGQWYSNRKTYLKTGKSHHRHSLKHLWK
ncbi:hypothetical protein BGZ70_000108 [Mortierella alpina]|uniref:Uncharacterized protein n=1 Tax=Mortierella alpina TaxID=64518 RepID=A0A9P6IYK7_MORAP|nr:hypothetical protein BGZ70_000108 [Mortierella alpina]